MSVSNDLDRPHPASRGRICSRRLEADPRFAYGLFVPDEIPGEAPLGLLVAVHDSRRKYLECVHGFCAFASSHQLAVLAPLFPRDVQHIGLRDGYKLLHEPGLRYDLLLHAMVDELGRSIACHTSRFFLHGYSGGAQFAHRYLLLHPQRVRAASVGAPGGVTLVDEEADWWAGVRDIDALFGQRLDESELRQVPLQLMVGELDTGFDEMREQPPSRLWRSDDERRGANRIDRLRMLRRSLEAIGVRPSFQMLPGLRHGDGPWPAMALSQRFFAAQLRSGSRAATPSTSPSGALSAV
jgi:pimeloyl-ACP methyl ester carboxylesterase